MEIPPKLLSSELLTYLWVLGVSTWGGLVSYFDERSTKESETGETVKFSFTKLMVRISSAAFAGLITMYLCQWSNLPTPLTGALVGIASHLGTPAFMKLKFIKNLLDK